MTGRLSQALLCLTLGSPCAVSLSAQTAPKRPIGAGDVYRLKDVGSPEMSPDGKWVAYTVTTSDSVKDRTNTDIWMAAWDGSAVVCLTSGPDAEYAPRWSPDGRYLSFLSARQGGDGGPQLWLLALGGGEAERVTDVRPGIQDYAWAPDGKRLVLAIKDRDSVRTDPSPKPIIIDRWLFKQDGVGYLSRRRTHLYLFDLVARRLDQLTSGDFDDAGAAWSHDGRSIAFESRRGPGDDRSVDQGLFVIEPRPGVEPRLVATFPGVDAVPGRTAPTWSPDGRTIAVVRTGDPKYWQYNNAQLALVPATGGTPRSLTEKLDRQVYAPRWSTDGQALYGLLEEDRTVHLARVGVDGAVSRLTAGSFVLSGLSIGGGGRIAVAVSTDDQPIEIAAVEDGRLRRLTHHNDSLMATIQLAKVEDFSSTSKDGTVVNGLLYRPAAPAPDRKLPALVVLHGGPFGQNQHDFDLRRQVFAAAGYAIISPNYRGSSGRGEAYSRAIFADWGNKEVTDLLGAVDRAVDLGIADPDRLGIGGWSYGGILTDYTIATDNRFKAAVAGAGTVNWLAMYGTDQFVFLYENELGSPWTNPDAWLKVSYPFLHADRIKTPTQFMGGEKDFNVPIAGGEQMYQALRTLGVESRLVIYPGMFHGPTIPSYRRDNMERFLEWWGRFLKPPAP